MVAAFYRTILRFRWAVLAGLLALTGGMALVATGVRIESSTTDLFPSTHPYVATFHQYGERFGSANRLAIMVSVNDETIFNIPTLQKIQRVHRAVERLKGVNKSQLLSIASRKARTAKATSERGLESSFVMWPEVPRTDEEVEKVRHAVLSNRFVYGPLVSLDQKAALVVAEFFEHQLDPLYVHEQISEIIAAESDDNTQVHAIGRPMVVGHILSRAPELGRIMSASGGFMLLVLWLCFRRSLGVIVPAASALVSAIMGIGTLAWLGRSLDPLAMVIPFVITARALSHSAQMVGRFLAERAEGKTPLDAAYAGAVALFHPGALAVCTDSIAVILIFFVPIPLLQKLALLGTLWLLSIFVSGMVLSPVLLSLFPERYSRPRAVVRPVLLSALGRVSTGRARRGVLGGALALLVLGGYLARGVEIGDAHAGTALLWPDSSYNRDSAAIAERFSNTEQLTVVVEGASPEALKSTHVVETIEAFQRHMETLPEVGTTSSIVDLLPSIVSLFYGEDPKWALLPDNDGQLRFFLELLYTSGDRGDRDRFITSDHKDASIVIYLQDHRGETLRKVVAHAQAFIAENPLQGARFRLAGGYGGLLAAINEDIAKFDVRITALAFLSVFLCCVLAFRSVTAGALFLLPLIASNCLTYAAMAVFEIGLDVNALPVVALGVGLGVDYGLYVVEAVKERFRIRADVRTAILEGLQSAGGPVLITGLTTVLGLSVWRFSFLRFQADMGLLLTFWMLVSAIGALVVLPCLLMHLKPRFVFGSPACGEPNAPARSPEQPSPDLRVG